MRAQILLFDMDGTLIDSSKAIATAWSSWAGRYGLDAEQVIEYGHGRKTVATMATFDPRRRISRPTPTSSMPSLLRCRIA